MTPCPECERLRTMLRDVRNYLRDVKIGEMELLLGWNPDRSKIDRFTLEWDANTNKILYGEEIKNG